MVVVDNGGISSENEWSCDKSHVIFVENFK